ncbi:MAG TPA: TldD/PmbA family protein [Anaerolineaceae bacterium]|nr:TldD/PmbA family protein [Anaerolineaceae bacterium]
MYGREQLKTICEKILRRVEAGGAVGEVFIATMDEALTRFANNTIHQNVSESNVQISLRALVGLRAGMASTNRVDDAALDELVAAALAHARISPEDPEDVGPAQPAPLQEAHAFDPATAECSPELRAQPVKAVCLRAMQAGLNAAGAFSTTRVETAIANSQGVFAYHPHTECDFQTTVMSDDSSGRAEGFGWKMDDVAVEALGEQAIKTTLRGRAPRLIEPGEFTVVLSPYAVLDIISNLNMHGVSGQSILDGRSWMDGLQGTQAMSPLVSLWDDAYDPRGLPMPFDGEGLPRQRVDIVREGVVGDAVYDRYTARKASRQPTGHAISPEWRSMGPMATNLFMAPGQSTLEEMIAGTQRGVLVTRFWYTRQVHPRGCLMTGMTRDGAFWIENGEIAYGIKNLRFTQAYVDALANVSAATVQDYLLRTAYMPVYARIPALKIEKFRFTGVSGS